jgi:ssRNA-specific RNase YbeY (16S rRNA maturation enzyme)
MMHHRFKDDRMMIYIIQTKRMGRINMKQITRFDSTSVLTFISKIYTVTCFTLVK